MKVLEAQNALLSNFEVFEFLTERQEQLGKQKQKQSRRRGPGTLETLIQEVRLERESDVMKFQHETC